MDIGLLADPTRCPDCAISLPASPPECPACGLPLRGHLADQLWRVSVAAAGMLEERGKIIGRLRAGSRVTAGSSPGWTQPSGPQPALGLSSGTPGAGWLPPPRSYDGAMAGEPDPIRDPARPHQVQRVLLGLGVLLLAIAALIFTVVAWGRIGIGGRSAILAAVTGAAAWASVAARRRELPGTAEALALLTTAFLLLDAFGARSSNLAGLADSAVDAYWAAVVAALAALGAALWRAHPLHTVRHATLVAAQLPLLLLGDRLPNATLAALLCTQGAGAVLVARRLDRTSLRVLAGVGGTWAYGGGLLAAATQAYARDEWATPNRLFPALCALALAALVAAYVAWDAEDRLVVRLFAAGAATGALLLAVHAPLDRRLDLDASTAWGSAVLLLAVAVLLATPAARAPWRAGPFAAVGLGFAAAVLAVAEHLAEIVAGTLGRLSDAWSAEAGGSARDLLAEPWTGTGVVPVTLGLLTAGAALAAWRLRSGVATVAAGLLATGAAISLPVALDVPYLAAVLSYVAVGGALLAAAARLYGTASLASTAGEAGRSVDGASWAYDPDRTTSPADLAAAGLAVAGTIAALLGLAWSLAVDTATPWALVVALAGVAAAHALDPRTDRPAPVVVGVPLLVAEVAVLAWHAGAGRAGSGFAGVLAACLLTLAAAHLPGIGTRPNERLALEATGFVAGMLAFTATTADPLWTSNALLAAGTTAALMALLPDRHPLAWLSGALVTAAGWVRLAEANVETPEAYTTGPALALLAAGWWNRRGTPTGPDGAQAQPRSSWATYAPGLTMGLLPSLYRVAVDSADGGYGGFGGAGFDEHGLGRPLLLGLAALVVLLLGARYRLQAPLLLGAGVLATDAVILLAPYADAVPRWVSIGAAGVLLLGLGATYEKRLRDLRRLKDKLDSLA